MDGGCRVDRLEVYVSEHWVSYALTASRLSYWTKLWTKLLASSGLTTGLEHLVDYSLITLDPASPVITQRSSDMEQPAKTVHPPGFVRSAVVPVVALGSTYPHPAVAEDVPYFPGF